METILLFVSSWWWIAPAAAGAGAATYAGMTTRPRRARRLELDAARHEEKQAYRSLVEARAVLRVAQADLLTAKSRGAFSPDALEAKRDLQSAKQRERTASLALRASRSRVKAGYTQYRTASAGEPLPIDRLAAVHDAVNARWLTYETDVDLALAFPQLTDARNPATLVFLRAQREALAKRPMLRERATPRQYAEYRVAVRALEVALIDAERQAGVHGTTASATAATAASVSAAAVALADLAGRLPSLISRAYPARDAAPPTKSAP
ncbi:hypothetical protein [Microbacterium sp. CFBP9034]|uniref:hypothetical protein n=1 Tax=Microbacterium sp. CFBP9034 TaxID=3096540 RepID=UPI002A6AC71E|nr:hypothetical protein [Microbacterium sp. CFBP9034]MDY0908042.1 hypothetical protein [Microbacterium sp. CFBP9034]